MSVDGAATEARRPQRRGVIRNRLLAEIVEVLVDVSGSAHQDVVIGHIALRRGEPASEHLRREVVEGFEAHLAKARRRPEALLVRPAFGEGSRRWTLEPRAWERVRKPKPMPAWPMVSPAR